MQTIGDFRHTGPAIKREVQSSYQPPAAAHPSTKSMSHKGQCTFLTLAVEWHLITYTKKKLTSDPQLLKANEGRPDLDCFIETTVYWDLNADMEEP
jgi:hypothetical protein